MCLTQSLCMYFFSACKFSLLCTSMASSFSSFKICTQKSLSHYVLFWLLYRNLQSTLKISLTSLPLIFFYIAIITNILLIFNIFIIIKLLHLYLDYILYYNKILIFVLSVSGTMSATQVEGIFCSALFTFTYSESRTMAGT